MFSFFKKTVDSIIADISSRIEHLHVVAEGHAIAASAHAMEIEARTALKADAEAEYARAKRIADKFLAIIS